MSTPELKPMPRGTEVVIVTKQSVAQSQLESAIWLWFNDGDPVAIHTLAAAAHDCFHALVEHAEKPTDWQAWLKTKSKQFREKMPIAQNFFKHGKMKLKGKLRYPTIQGEMLMMDAVSCYELLFQKLTPLMKLYGTCFLYEHPSIIAEDALPKMMKDAEIHQLTDSTRHEFYLRFLASLGG